MSEALLSTALSCFPKEHLKVCFARILADIRANRCGLPDLVQFWPEERRYRLIEVKGPGDRLQDNQLRWLTFCAAHDIPVSVCHVSWDARGMQGVSPVPLDATRMQPSSPASRDATPMQGASAASSLAPASAASAVSAGERV
jgi:hypothetical protein